MNQFVVKRLFEQPSTFYEALPRNKSQTLATMLSYNVTIKGPTAETTKDVKTWHTLFHRLVVAQEAGHDINLENLPCHELSKTPLAIAEANGNLYFTSAKAGLSKILHGSFSDILKSPTVRHEYCFHY